MYNGYINTTAQWPFPPTAVRYTFTPVDNAKLHTYAIIEPQVCHAISETGKGGVTIAYSKTSEFKNTRMVEVALAYCSPHEVFTKKIGTRLAKEKFEAGKTVQVPVGIGADMVHRLKTMFWYNLED